eukprot:6356312-Heterocapsa_arctica.AAC.1
MAELFLYPRSEDHEDNATLMIINHAAVLHQTTSTYIRYHPCQLILICIHQIEALPWRSFHLPPDVHRPTDRLFCELVSFDR